MMYNREEILQLIDLLIDRCDRPARGDSREQRYAVLTSMVVNAGTLDTCDMDVLADMLRLCRDEYKGIIAIMQAKEGTIGDEYETGK